MAVNLELKSKIESHKSIKIILESIGAEFKNILNQKDIYYKVDKGLLKLRIENGNYSLIRYNREENNPDRWSNYHVVQLKGEETELLFESLFEIETEVIKTRELYLYKDTRVHLDYVENLGSYIELETVVSDSKERAKMLFDEMVNLLKLDLSNQIRSSYRDLILSK
ncbi:MAG: CYTH domain-containing protein [Bacteroidota bacterium]